MSTKPIVNCLIVLTLLLSAAAVSAQNDGSVMRGETPNVGTAQFSQIDGQYRGFAEVRIFESYEGGDDLSNTTLSLGFTSPINPRMSFGLTYCDLDNLGRDPIASAVRRSELNLLSPSIKAIIWQPGPILALTVGSDVTMDRSKGHNTATGAVAYQPSFTPAAKLQLEWGDPGGFQWQLAGQVAWWETTLHTSIATTIPGFGRVVGVGGAFSLPVSKQLTIVADGMTIVEGENYINETTNLPDDEFIWSAGGNWALGDAQNTVLSVFATNVTGPTLATSLIGSPDSSVSLGIALRRDL